MTLAASALRYLERRQEVTANNLANTSTDGFKAERVFARALDGELPAADTATDFRQGTLRETGGALDFALEGDAFLVVRTPAGDRLVRGGTFQLDEARRIVDADGHPLLMDRGPLELPLDATSVRVTRTGEVHAVVAGGQPREDSVARLRVERPAAGAVLAHDGANRWRIASGATECVDDDARIVRQGWVEESNVTAIDAVVDMIAIQRAYAAAQKAVSTLDDVRGTAVNDIGKPV